ncbi:MAG TPA: hypothetical protein VFH80_24800 [Solirubrobacteraceae bacterium]|nr:hypothetical protein [Solirubrobacteraceae bacterium]
MRRLLLVLALSAALDLAAPSFASASPALVSLGVVTTGSQGASVTPSFGQTPTANDLLVLWVQGDDGGTRPATPSGWSSAGTQDYPGAGEVGLFYRVAAGGDAAPTVAAAPNTTWSAELGEFSGIATSGPLDETGGAGYGNSPLLATAAATDAAPGELVVYAGGATASPAEAYTLSMSLNNGAAAHDTTNTGVSADHYLTGYGVTTGNSSADSASMTFDAYSGNGVDVLASFKPACSTAPTVTTQPSDQDVTATSAATFSAAASNGGCSALSVQWQRSVDGGGTWSDDTADSGNATDTLTVSPTSTSQSGYEYRAVFTNEVGSADSTAAQLSVDSSSSRLYGTDGGPYSSDTGLWPGEGWQPYSSTSTFANTELPSWEAASVYSDSANEIAYMSANWPGNWTPWTFSNAASNDESSRWGHPLYFASNSDPLYTITGLPTCSVGNGNATFCPTKLRIPNGAMHASGSDGHMEIVEPAGFYSAGGTDPQGQPAGAVDEVDFYQVGNANPITGGGSITASFLGGLITASFMGGLDFSGNGCCGYSTALNQGLAGLMVRAQDLRSGTINHALGGSFECTNGTNVAPWPLVGGGQACANGGDGPALGSRLQLKMDDSTIDGLSIPAWEKIVYKALAHYGLYVTDTGGSPMDPEFEPAVDYTSFGNTSNTLMTYFADQGFLDPYTVTISIPWSDFQIVAPCYAQRTC